MKLSIYEACRLKRMLKCFLFLSFGIALFYSAVCQTVYNWAISDILIAEGIFPVIWKMLSDTIDYAYYVVALIFMLYLISRYTIKNCYRFFLIFLGASAFKYLASLLSAYALNGFADFVINDLLDVLMYACFDALQMVLAAWIAWRILQLLQERAVRAHYLELTKNPLAEPEMPQWLPFDSMWNFKNELMRAAFCVSFIPAAVRLIGRMYYDIFFWGAPVNTADTMWMIFGYLSDAAMWFVGYLVIVLILNYIDGREEKKRKAYLASIK